MSLPPPAVGPGFRLGRYVLVEKVGAGGMGDVYRALDTGLEREVAVKILPSETFATEERRRRFETEAKSAATVSHPNLVAVFDFGETDGGILYIVQELVRGKTLNTIISEDGPIPVERAAVWGAQAAEGLAKAHEAGIVHRDVKPGNLIVDDEGRLRVLDFGLAKMLGSGRRVSSARGPETEHGLVVGTIHYMSPEQSLGRELDARSDVFSLGVTLYEMVTGKRPFDGTSAVDTLHAIAHDPPRAIQPADLVPRAFAAILERALEKRPKDRYQSLREMAADLHRVGRHEASLTASQADSESTMAVRAVKPRRAPRAPRLAIAAALALGALAAAWLLVRSRRPSVQPPRATRFLVQTGSSEGAPAFSPDGNAFAYASNARGDYDIYYQLVSKGPPVRLTATLQDERDPVFAPDGASVYFSRGDSPGENPSIWSVPALGGEARRIVDGGDQPAVSPDGKRLVFRRLEAGRTSLYEAGADGATPARLFTAPSGELLGARFSPDARTIAFLWREAFPGALGDVWTIPARGGQPTRVTRDRKDVWGHVEWLGDRHLLFSAIRTGVANIWMVPVRGGEPSSVTSGTGWVISPSLRKDGRSILVQTQRHLSDAWEYPLPSRDTPAPRARALTRTGVTWAPVRLPNGRLLYADWARQEEEIDLYIEDDSGGRSLIAQGSNPRTSRDGKTVFYSVAVGEGKRALAAIPVDGGPSRRLTDPSGIDEYPDPTPDGASLTFCRSDPKENGVLLMPLAGGAPKTLFAGDAMTSRAGKGAVVFQSCAPPAGCGVYAVPYTGGAPALLVKDGRWPATSRDGATVYVLTGPKARPSLVKVPIGGGAPAPVLDLNPDRDPQFWAVFTIDVTEGEKSVIVTQQRSDDDVVLLEDVFR